MSKKTELVKNTLVIGLGRMLPQVIGFLLIPLYTIFLSPQDYGVVDLVIGLSALVVPLITLQLEFSVFRHLIDSRSDSIRTGEIIMSGLAALVVFTGILSVPYLLIGQFIEIPYFYIVILSILSTVFANFFSQISRGLGKNIIYAQGSIITAFVAIMANILLIAVFRLGAEGMLLAIALGSIAGSIFLYFRLGLKRYLKKVNARVGVLKELLKYSLPLVPGGVSWWIIGTADRFLIALILGVSSNGIYAIAYKFPLILNSFFGIFNMSWTESATLHINSKDRNKFFSDVFNLTIKLFGSLAVLIVAFVPLVFDILVNGEFHEAYRYIPIMVLGAFMNSMLSLYTSIYFAKKMTKDILSTVIIAATVSIALNALLLPQIGLYAAAISTTVAFGGMMIYRHYRLKEHVNITYSKWNIMILFILFAFSSAIYYLNNQILNYLNITIVLIMVLVFNKSTLSAVKNKLSKKRVPSVDQQTFEEISNA